MATRKKKTTRKASAVERLAVKELRWVCNPKKLAFDSTSEMEPISSVVGQDVAVEALRFGLETNAPGQNIFVRGLTGTGTRLSWRQSPGAMA